MYNHTCCGDYTQCTRLYTVLHCIHCDITQRVWNLYTASSFRVQPGKKYTGQKKFTPCVKMLHNEWNITVFYVPWGHFYSLALGFASVDCYLLIKKYVSVKYIHWYWIYSANKQWHRCWICSVRAQVTDIIKTADLCLWFSFAVVNCLKLGNSSLIAFAFPLV